MYTTFPETKPATEFIHGQLVQKMNARGLHARVEGTCRTSVSRSMTTRGANTRYSTIRPVREP
jgi:hypothetical protein